MDATPAQLAKHDQLVKTARTWVAQSFYGEMLKQMRNSPFKSEMFSGGRGGEVFQAQLDQKLAERMANSRSSDRLVSAMVRRIEKRDRAEALPVRRPTSRPGDTAAAKGTLIDVVDGTSADSTARAN